MKYKSYPQTTLSSLVVSVIAQKINMNASIYQSIYQGPHL